MFARALRPGVAVFVLTLASSVQATMLMQFNLKELATRADRVFRGTRASRVEHRHGARGRRRAALHHLPPQVDENVQGRVRGMKGDTALRGDPAWSGPRATAPRRTASATSPSSATCPAPGWGANTCSSRPARAGRPLHHRRPRPGRLPDHGRRQGRDGREWLRKRGPGGRAPNSATSSASCGGPVLLSAARGGHSRRAGE